MESCASGPKRTILQLNPKLARDTEVSPFQVYCQMKSELDLQKTNYENLASEHTQLKMQLEQMDLTNKGQTGLTDLLEL